MSLPSSWCWKMLCDSRSKLTVFLSEQAMTFFKRQTKGDLIINFVQVETQDSCFKKSFEDRYLKELSEGNGMILRSDPEAQISLKMQVLKSVFNIMH